MKTLLITLAFFSSFFLLASCEGETPLLKISQAEHTWIPYSNYQEIQFQNSANEIVTLKTNIQNKVISRSGKTLSSAYNQEEVSLYLYSIAPHKNSLALALRPSKVFIGASIDASGTNAQAIIKKEITGYKVEDDKYNIYSFLPEITLNGIKYRDVIYRRNNPDFSGNNYFPEYYYAKEKGLVALKLDGRSEWFYLKS